MDGARLATNPRRAGNPRHSPLPNDFQSGFDDVCLLIKPDRGFLGNRKQHDVGHPRTVGQHLAHCLIPLHHQPQLSKHERPSSNLEVSHHSEGGGTVSSADFSRVSPSYRSRREK